ncbi:MAG: prolyl oligopeptidase family serine peptidase [Flavobacteriaceae bacterium]|nr:MAG: prolyl oligopeptidase family serine peptidase [Flavobacteriaceae bacterium]
MQTLKNFPLKSKHGKSIIMDIYYKKTAVPKPLVIFCHGYKGYKDWGVFDKTSKWFVDKGLILLKFNFSHNGGTLEQPVDFPDLEAFGNNNYMIELDDLTSVLDWVTSSKEWHNEMDIRNIILIGHSRGGGISILKASRDRSIKKLITWASVCDLHRTMFEEGDDLEQWKKDGVCYVENGRTGQQMPHYIQFYDNYKENKDHLNIQKAIERISIPHLIIHGDADTSVPVEHSKNLHKWNPNSELYIVPKADHVFGARQPWTEVNFPEHFVTVLEKTFDFIQNT